MRACTDRGDEVAPTEDRHGVLVPRVALAEGADVEHAQRRDDDVHGCVNLNEWERHGWIKDDV
jgi:hypothetical protein